MSRYAQGTTVSVAQSRGEITGILAKHGVERMAWASEPSGDHLTFELAGNRFLFRITKPTTQGLWDQWKADGRPQSTLKYLPNDDQVDAEWRRRWRANVLLLKAKLEFIDGGETTIDREFMAYRVLADGRTLEEAIANGDSKLLLAAGR